MPPPPAWAPRAAETDADILRCLAERPDWFRTRLAPPWTDLDAPGGCWEWRGERNPKGYGRMTLPAPYFRRVRAHRAAWLVMRGPLGYGMTIDHVVCQNTGCVNPDHLEEVTLAENLVRRHVLAGSERAAGEPGACLRGHPLTDDNIRLNKAAKGERECLTCHNARNARDAELHRQAAQRLGLTVTEYRTQYGQSGRRAAEVLGIPWEAARHLAA
jgi:hypothetical protein